MHPLHHWLGATREQRQAAITELFSEPWSPKHDYARLVEVPGHWGVFASLGQHYHYAVFGRDSIETAEDLLCTHPQLVRDIILVLCRLQGVRWDLLSEEEPGKIHHEHRQLHLNGFVIPEHSRVILKELQRLWGIHSGDEVTYFGTFDATPLFIRLVGSYISQYGDSILSETYRNRNGHVSTVRDSLLAALAWLVDKIMAHPLGLFAYKRLNPNGTANQVWKDSSTSHLHSDGSLPNFDGSVASIGLQGFAYDALRTGATLHLGTRKLQQLWRDLADHIQRQTLVTLWMDDQHYFAQGIDFDDHRQPRQIATITSDPATLLDCQLLHDLPPSHAGHYIHAIAKMVYSPELLTESGVRSRALRHWNVMDFYEYHGSSTVWPKESFDIAKGFRRAGMHHLAADMERRVASSLQRAAEFSEFFYVNRKGNTRYFRNKPLTDFDAKPHRRFEAMPEAGQAWTIAAAIRIAASRSLHKSIATPPSDFERSLLPTD